MSSSVRMGTRPATHSTKEVEGAFLRASTMAPAYSRKRFMFFLMLKIVAHAAAASGEISDFCLDVSSLLPCSGAPPFSLSLFLHFWMIAMTGSRRASKMPPTYSTPRPVAHLMAANERQQRHAEDLRLARHVLDAEPVDVGEPGEAVHVLPSSAETWPQWR